MKVDLLIFLLAGIILMAISVIIFSFIPPHIRCRWGLHEWMSPNYPWWGGCEQGTYCCDLTMKIERIYVKGKCVSKKRMPFTDEDLLEKKKRFKEHRDGIRVAKFERKLHQDMKSDDFCEELLP